MDYTKNILAIVDKWEQQPPTQLPFIGQHEIKQQIAPFLNNTQFPNTLIVGEPGLGKTQLALHIASHNPHLTTITQIAPIAKPPDSDILILDEAHRQRQPEMLFPYMAKHTILAATTRPDKLDDAFTSRFFLRIQLTRYNIPDMELIIENLWPGIDPHHATILAQASAGNPRQAHRLVTTAKALQSSNPDDILPVARINANGLTDLHMNYLQALHRMGRPTGINQLATLLYQDEATLHHAERLLIDYQLIDLTTNGRTLTSKGTMYVDIMKEDTNGH